MKKYLITSIFIIVILLVIFFTRNLFSQNPQKDEAIEPTPSVALPTITDDIKVDLRAKNNNRAVVLKITGIPKDIALIEYELTYQTGEGLARGVLGSIKLDNEDEIERDDIVLGTCSSGKCVYDTGVEKVSLSLKFNSNKGSMVFRKDYDL